MTSTICVNIGTAALPTVTAKLFADGSDTVVETVSLTEATNRKGVYSGTTATTATGLYLAGIYSAGTFNCNRWVRLSNTSPTWDYAESSRFDALSRVLLPGTWDFGTAIDGLHMSYADIYRALGSFLGYGSDATRWTDDQESDAVEVVRSGLRSFYWPSVEGERYTWSFLRKSATITTVAETGDYALATDFGGRLIGFNHAVALNRRKLSRIGEDEILSLRGQNDRSGVPLFCALSAVQPGAGGKTTWQVLLYPRPDAVYTLNYRYAIDPPLDSDDTYHLGGSVHSETVLEACLAAAEKLRRPELGDGVHYQRFMERLKASISVDMEMQ